MTKKTANILAFIVFSATCIDVYPQVAGIDDSPYTIENSEYTVANSPFSEANNEFNMNNSKFSHGDNIIRDETGNAIAYTVPKEGGGMNIYGYDGVGRIGYTTP